MNEPLSQAYLARFSETLVSEIKAEMGRKAISSSRALARALGESSQWVSTRLDGGNPRTGERVQISVRDLAAIAAALDIHPSELITRTKLIVDGPSDGGTVTPIRPKPSDGPSNLDYLKDLPSIAEPEREDVEGDMDPDLQ